MAGFALQHLRGCPRVSGGYRAADADQRARTVWCLCRCTAGVGSGVADFLVIRCMACRNGFAEPISFPDGYAMNVMFIIIAWVVDSIMQEIFEEAPMSLSDKRIDIFQIGGCITESSGLNETLLEEWQLRIWHRFGRALSIRHVDAGSCNGCELEIQAMLAPQYDLTGLGIHFCASPRHADLLLVTGPVSRAMVTALHRTYQAMPEPRWVVAVGDCGRDGGIFGSSYACCGGVDQIIPVDVWVPGCAPTPRQLLQGIWEAVTQRLPS